jgi:hypothetical protein
MARGKEERQTAATPSQQRDGTASSLPVTGEGNEPAGPAGASGTEDEFALLTSFTDTENVNKASNTYIKPTKPKSKKVKMTNDNSTSSSLYLPASLKLKGEENYNVWKEQMLDLATSNQLKKYISEKARKPVFVDEDDEKADADKLDE